MRGGAITALPIKPRHRVLATRITVKCRDLTELTPSCWIQISIFSLWNQISQIHVHVLCLISTTKCYWIGILKTNFNIVIYFVLTQLRSTHTYWNIETSKYWHTGCPKSARYVDILVMNCSVSSEIIFWIEYNIIFKNEKVSVK